MKRITYVATEVGLHKANKALRNVGSKVILADVTMLSPSTIRKFFSREPIQKDSFKRICDQLKLDWKEIAGETEDKNFEQIDQRQIEPIFKMTMEGEAVQTVTRVVLPIDEQGQEIKTAAVVLEGDINSFKIDLLILQEFFSEQYPGSSLKIKAIKQGSIKLIIEGSQEDIDILLSDFESGELTEINGYPVQNIQRLVENPEDDESSEQKWRLVEEIRTNQIQGRDLRCIDLSDADLSGVNLSGADLSGADLSDADLSGANLKNADLRRTDLSRADLSDAYLSNTNLSDANLKNADLRRTDLSDADLSRADLSDAYLSDAYLSNTNLSDADLRYAYLRYAYLSRAYLSRAYLSDAYLSDAYLSGAYLSGAYLSNANLNNADLSDADLSGANLSGADLSDADLRYANLSGANLSNANLNNADLRYAYLSVTNLSGANVEETKFSYSKGISEEMKQDLIKRGAIFEDSPGERSPILTH